MSPAASVGFAPSAAPANAEGTKFRNGPRNPLGRICRMAACLSRCDSLGSPRGGGVSRVAKGADCKAPSSCRDINIPSENSSVFDLFPINRLDVDSERCVNLDRFAGVSLDQGQSILSECPKATFRAGTLASRRMRIGSISAAAGAVRCWLFHSRFRQPEIVGLFGCKCWCENCGRQWSL
jgi:hypothetical protein